RARSRLDLGLRTDATRDGDLEPPTGSPAAPISAGTTPGSRSGDARSTPGRGDAGAGTRGDVDGRRNRGREAPRSCRESHKSGARSHPGRPLRLIYFLLPANAQFAGLFS